MIITYLAAYLAEGGRILSKLLPFKIICLENPTMSYHLSASSPSKLKSAFMVNFSLSVIKLSSIYVKVNLNLLSSILNTLSSPSKTYYILTLLINQSIKF